MDTVQKVALVALIAVGVVITVYVVNTINIESARVEAEQLAILEHDNMCTDWSDELGNMRAELVGRENSLGGELDLDGSVAVFRNQFNLEIDRYNAECAGVETNYFEENQ